MLLNDFIGKTVTWESQSQGTTKRKTGKVIGVVPAGKHLSVFLPAGVKNSRLKTDMVSQRDRIIVEVPRGGKSVLTDFYAPYERSVTIVEG